MIQRFLQPLRLVAAGAFCCYLLSGCMVMAVGGAAVSVTASAVELAADVAVGSAKLVGHGVKAGMDAMSDDHAETPAAPDTDTGVCAVVASRLPSDTPTHPCE